MRRIAIRMIGLLLLMAIMAGCTPIVESGPEATTIYVTFYPIYALTHLVVEDVPNLELHCLVQPQSACIRSYSVSDWDISILSRSADVVIMGGRGLESFESMLQSAGESVMPVVEVLYGLDLLEGNADDEESESHWCGANPHLYMSVAGAMRILENIAGSMVVLDSANEDLYVQNQKAALQRLEELQREMLALTESCRGTKTAILNEALVYAAEDYSLDVVAQFPRESGENLYGTDREDCLNLLSESGAELILIERQAPKDLVDALQAEGFSVARLDLLDMCEEADGAQGYFDAQRANAEAIANACSALKNQTSGEIK